MDCTFDFDLHSQLKAENHRQELSKFDSLPEPQAEPQSITDLLTGQFLDETVSEYSRSLVD